jgi:hypothetical protein
MTANALGSLPGLTLPGSEPSAGSVGASPCVTT